MSTGTIVTLGDACVSIQLGTGIDATVNARCISLAGAFQQLSMSGVRDVVPTYNAVTVHFDPRVTESFPLAAELERLAAIVAPVSDSSATIEIPVTYGGAGGIDLPVVAGFAKCSEAEVVRIHAATEYRVYMLGFLPGFAYMGTVDSRIAMPRLETPRTRVSAGSVAIAGSQTGIYPCETPGGWRVIGTTSARMFDPAREQPFLVKAGDRVKFVAA